VRFTKTGAVIFLDKDRARMYSLKWAGSEPGGAAYLAGLAVSRAQNQQEFLAALGRWKIPSLNFVYADKDGTIGWVAAGAMPIRPKHDGLLPVPANEGYEWTGYLSVKDLPQKFNPKAGWLGTANHNILYEGYQKQVSYEFAPPYRFLRVKHNLESKDKFDLGDFQAFQHDDVSIPGQKLAALLQQVKFEDAAVEGYARMMRKWDGKLSRASQAGVVYAFWLKALQEAVYEPLAPKELRKELATKSGLPTMLRAMEKPDEKWFGPNPRAQRDKILKTTFAASVAEVRQRWPNPADMRWGKLHTATFHHPLAKELDVGPFARTGDVNTPNNTRYDDHFKQVHGATYRQLFDLADWDRGLATSAPGQSGQPGSPHYGDLAPLWAEGRYFPLAYSRAKVEEVTQHRLWLRPG
jgi:penicillin amidase